jgi:hypothetical protein
MLHPKVQTVIQPHRVLWVGLVGAAKPWRMAPSLAAPRGVTEEGAYSQSN